MNELKKGHFYGHTNSLLALDNLTFTETEYTIPKVDWHFHETPYFTFILDGGLMEGNRKEKYECVAGDLLFHNWQDAHYNIASAKRSRGFHVEFDNRWLESFDVSLDDVEGSMRVLHPKVKCLFYQLYAEWKETVSFSDPDKQATVLEILLSLKKAASIESVYTPSWVKKVRDYMNDMSHEKLRLADVAAAAEIHPVHLCRNFRRYFQTGFNDYLRYTKIEKALSLLGTGQYSMTEIAFECGFADQSHFNRSFKKLMAVNPRAYKVGKSVLG